MRRGSCAGLVAISVCSLGCLTWPTLTSCAVGCFGDSHTEGIYGAPWVDELQRRLRRECVNFRRNAWTCKSVQRRAAQAPILDEAVVLAGTNDAMMELAARAGNTGMLSVYRGLNQLPAEYVPSIESFATSFKELLSSVRAEKVAVLSLPPLGESDGRAAELLSLYNQEICRLVEEDERAIYVPFGEALEKRSGEDFDASSPAFSQTIAQMPVCTYGLETIAFWRAGGASGPWGQRQRLPNVTALLRQYGDQVSRVTCYPVRMAAHQKRARAATTPVDFKSDGQRYVAVAGRCALPVSGLRRPSRAREWLFDLLQRSRLHITNVTPPANRPPCIPGSVLKQRQGEQAEDEGKEPLERERMEELGGAGVYSVDLWRKAILEDPNWKYDIVPEIMDGHNIVDFVDPDIDRKLEELEREEALLMAESSLGNDDEVIGEFEKTQKVLDEVHSRMRQKRLERRIGKSRTGVPTPRRARKKAEEVEEKLNSIGLDGAKVRGRSASKKRSGSLLRKRKHDAGEEEAGTRTLSRARSRSIGLPSEGAAQVVEKKRRKTMRLHQKKGHKGEADRWIPDLKPKHLYSGKRGIGKTDRR
ncbi:unnamed protein product [Cladocopium goreaui]|uniref:Nucleolar GTP-binding protein 1 n=1 Tax=Cladocopium goreaui TaxID=2562237 RepID=A0A9P1FJV7_9DINO|nr:unnamed protein product [Cladocopium goreaui]